MTARRSLQPSTPRCALRVLLFLFLPVPHGLLRSACGNRAAEGMKFKFRCNGGIRGIKKRGGMRMR